jgi:hypothetical protein
MENREFIDQLSDYQLHKEGFYYMQAIIRSLGFEHSAYNLHYSEHSYTFSEHPVTNPFYIRQQRHGFTALIRDTHLTHMPLVSAILNYLSASKQTLYDMALSSVPKGTLCAPPGGPSTRQTLSQSPRLSR